MKELLFSFSVCKHVSSNAIVISKNQQVLGIGGGQTNRVDSIMIALKKMRENFGKINNYVVAHGCDLRLPLSCLTAALSEHPGLR